ncbi:hypothetical protein LAZ67_5002775 [Cordylochernes scorpioides]|uniref:PiggyBac transposable element-derived protein domain-containing protein n=1 Tax=Cordylochernes scorpioides TaxID=51811 RepID=A0ABY6KGN1_9ARAC|nr:hypothetical protein LAZ67_5002775 [Cordylochernes scorpioides]
MDTSTISNSDSKNEVFDGTSYIYSNENTEIYNYHDLIPNWNLKTKNLVHLQLPVSMWGETRQRGERPVNGKVQRIRGNFTRERDAKDTNEVESWALIGLVMEPDSKFPAPIREIFEEFVTNCKTMYHPRKYSTLDENIIPFKGRCSFKQYLPNKPAKYGIETYVLCCSRTSYVQREGPYQISKSSNNVVERLVLPIFGSKRNITTDNWYTSYPLAVALLNDHKLTLVGTLKITGKKKEIPPEYMPNRARQVFSSIFGFQKKNVSLVSYVPKRGKSVIPLSIMHSTAIIDEETNEKKKREMITFYNMTKEGVDLLDQKTSLYSVGQRTRRWPLCIFFELLNISGVNSKLLFDGNQPQNFYKRRKDFLKALSLELVTEYHIRSTTKSFSKPLRSIVRKHAGQSPETMEEDIPEPLSKAQKRCHLCSYKKYRKTKPLCQKCQKNVCKEHPIIMCRQCM